MRVLRAYLVASGALFLAWGIQLALEAARRYAAMGWISGRLLGAIGAAFVAVALTPVALRRLRRFDGSFAASRGPRFSARAGYYRLVVLALFVAFLASIFGSRADSYVSFAVHVLGVVALHRCLLSFPEALQRIVEGIGEKRVTHALDIALTNAMAFLVLAEISVRGVLLLQGPIPWLPEQVNPLATKLREPIFGSAPNRLGYNDREFASEKKTGTLRIAAIGDSFFVGHVPRSYGVIARTERVLDDRDPENSVEVFNFGIVATSPSEYLEILRRDALRFDPDAVVVGVYVGNDIKFAHRLPTPFEKRWYALYQYKERWRRSQLAQRAVADTEFVDLTEIETTDREFWFSDRVPAVQSRDGYLKVASRHAVRCGPPTTARREAEWQATLDALARMKDTCDEAGVPLLMVLEPDHVQVSSRLRAEIGWTGGPDIRYPQTRLRAFANRHGIPCLDLLAAFEAAEDPDALYLRNDNHWSARGNELAARVLAGWLDRTLEIQ